MVRHGLKGRHLEFREDKLYGREDLLNQLRNVYYETLSFAPVNDDGDDASGQSKDRDNCDDPTTLPTMVLVSGYSGAGKSSLIYKFRDSLLTTKTTNPAANDRQKHPCWFISGTFEELKTTPYSAILQAFSAYCDQLINSDDHKEVRRVIEGIQRAIGNEGSVLTGMIPQLARLLICSGDIVWSAMEGPEVSSCSGASQANSMNRLKFLFQAFVEVICGGGRPLVLFLDDLQRADTASLDLLSALMTTPGLGGKFMLIGSYRSNEVNDHHPLAVALDEMERKRKSAPEIVLHVSNLAEEAINHFISDTLRLDPEETWSITAAVYRKTEGNIFYTMQLLEQLTEKDGLRYDCSVSFQWVWDVDRINQEMDLTDNVVDVVTARLTNLPQQLQTTLSVAGFIGKSFDLQIVQDFILKHHSQVPLRESTYYDFDIVELLDMAVDEGLLELEAMGTTCYRFAHDKIQQAACSLLPQEKNQCLLRDIGKYLAKLVFQGSGEDWMMFVAADHLNATLLSDARAAPAEMVALARLNHIVGERAVSLQAFCPASVYFRAGLKALERLPDSSWQSDYELTLKLYRAASSGEVSIGDFELGWNLAHELLDKAEDLSEKLPTYASLVFALTKRGRCSDAMDMVLKALDLLGEHPKRYQRYNLLKNRLFLRRAFRRHTDSDICCLPLMTDAFKVKAMEFMGQLLYLAFITQDMVLFFLTISRQLRLTFEVGLSGPAAFAFASYGVLLSGKPSEKPKRARVARRMGRLAHEVLHVTSEKRFKPVALFTVALFVEPWFGPLSSVMETLHTTHLAAMEIGDFDIGFRSFFHYHTTAFAAGTPLGKLERDGRQIQMLMDQYNAYCVKPSLDQFRILILTLTGSGIEDWREPYPADGSTFGHRWNIFSRLQLAYYFDDMMLADEICLLAMDNLLCGSNNFMLASHALFFVALVSMKKFLESGNRKSWKRARKVKKGLEAMRKTIGFNILHKYFIVEAQFLAVRPGRRKAHDVRAAFDKAISAASKTGFTQDLAIANELAGEYFLRANDSFWAKHYMSYAYQEYQCWKAHAKVEHLRQKHGELIDHTANVLTSTSLLKRRNSIQPESCNKHRSINLGSLRSQHSSIASTVPSAGSATTRS